MAQIKMNRRGQDINLDLGEAEEGTLVAEVTQFVSNSCDAMRASAERISQDPFVLAEKLADGTVFTKMVDLIAEMSLQPEDSRLKRDAEEILKLLD